MSLVGKFEVIYDKMMTIFWFLLASMQVLFQDTDFTQDYMSWVINEWYFKVIYIKLHTYNYNWIIGRVYSMFYWKLSSIFHKKWNVPIRRKFRCYDK